MADNTDTEIDKNKSEDSSVSSKSFRTKLSKSVWSGVGLFIIAAVIAIFVKIVFSN